MKKFYFLILMFLCFIGPACSIHLPINNLEQIFQAYLPQQKGIIYTKVPRGLVISIDEKIFFNKNDVRIKQSSLPILDLMAEILKNLPNEFVIEGHTSEKNSSYSGWELSIGRASNLAQYMTVYKKLSPNKVTPLGLSDFVPYRYPTSDDSFDLNNRIDFVIIEYDVKR